MIETSILTVNVGSTSAKLAVFKANGDLKRVAVTEVVRSNRPELDVWPDALAAHCQPPATVVHRIVHGGDEYAGPVAITPDVLERLRGMQRLAPEHLPPELDAVATAMRAFPAARHLACFDTAFHRHMPVVARMYPLDRRFWDAGVRRYGFHGLSCESIVESLGRIDTSAGSGRVIVAHLGGGSSLTAIRNGRGIDTTMGFSPAGGVMMSRRSGDLDPGVLLYALEEGRLDADGLRALVTHDAGLFAVSARTGDMRELLAAEASDRQAAEAIALYCYSARKALGGLVAALGALDTLVFTGGIGEHAAPIRERIVMDMTGFGIEIDPDRNRTHEPVISADESSVTVRVIPTAEDRVLASHALRLLSRSQ